MTTKLTIRTTWLDRAVGALSPAWQLSRLRARVAGEVMRRHYEGAGTGRRTQGWRKSGADVNAAVGPALTPLREAARDLVRNNPYAESALSTIVDHAVGWGIVPTSVPESATAQRVWNSWANTTLCDADGRHDFAGLEKLVMRTVGESGEVLVRRRIRRVEDGIPLNLQLQVMDPDYLDTSKEQDQLPNGGRIIQGVEFDAIGRRAAYWLFQEHPGSLRPRSFSSVRVPAEGILHIFKASRPGQVRGPSWFGPVLLRAKDFDDYEDATLMKQKIAACLAVLTTDVDGEGTPLGTADDTETPEIDALEPGAILNLRPGRSVEVVSPPPVNDYDTYSKTQLRAIATGLGVTYEDLTGDYQDMPFSAARMSRLRHWARVEDWRWRLLVPQFCVPVYQWAMENAVILGQLRAVPTAEWTAPPAPMVDPVNEGLAFTRNIRGGLQSLSDSLRERGYNPRTVLKEIASDNALLDELGLVLDSDPRKMTQAGQSQAALTKAAAGDDAKTAEDQLRHAQARGADLRVVR
jgi:lambda family phage portal protein